MNFKKVKPQFSKQINPRVGLIVLSTDIMIEKDFFKVFGGKSIDLYINRIKNYNPVTAKFDFVLIGFSINLVTLFFLFNVAMPYNFGLLTGCKKTFAPVFSFFCRFPKPSAAPARRIALVGTRLPVGVQEAAFNVRVLRCGGIRRRGPPARHGVLHESAIHTHGVESNRVLVAVRFQARTAKHDENGFRDRKKVYSPARHSGSRNCN